MNNGAIGESWEYVEWELFTPEEIAESRLRVALMGELIRARREQGMSQKKLGEMCGVRQPVIARKEFFLDGRSIGTYIRCYGRIVENLDWTQYISVLPHKLGALGQTRGKERKSALELPSLQSYPKQFTNPPSLLPHF